MAEAVDVPGAAARADLAAVVLPDPHAYATPEVFRL